MYRTGLERLGSSISRNNGDLVGEVNLLVRYQSRLKFEL